MAGIKGMKGGGGPRPGAGRKPKAPAVKPPVTIQDPLEFLRSVWSDPELSAAVRVRAAISHAGFVHGKPAAGGKREQNAQKAAEALQRATSKFAPGAPPLRVVGSKTKGNA